MSDASTGQLWKALALLAALVAFAWWQLRDVSQAQRSRRAQPGALPPPAAEPVSKTTPPAADPPPSA